MKVRIEIDTKTFIRFWLVVAGMGLAALAIYSARTALLILGISFFLALALNRPVSALANHLPGKSRVGGTAIAYVLVVGFLGVFLSLVVPPVIEQTAKVVGTVPTIVDQVQGQWKGLHDIVEHYGMQSQVNQAFDSIKTNAASWAANIGVNFLSSVSSLVGLLTGLLLVLVLTFLMLVEGPRWLDLLWDTYATDHKRKQHKRLASKMYQVVSGYVTGQLTVSSIGAFFAGASVFIMSFIFNIPHNLALPTAAITFLLSLIPMFGATIGGVLICLLLAFNDFSAALVYAIYFVIYQQVENNFIQPTVQAKSVELSALAVLTAVTIGLYMFGVVGGIISIPIAGSIKVLAEEYFNNRKERHDLREKPLATLVKKLKNTVSEN